MPKIPGKTIGDVDHRCGESTKGLAERDLGCRPIKGTQGGLALSSLKIKRWPFAGRIALRERSRDIEEFHVLEHWAYVGSARCEEELAALSARDRLERGTATRAAAVFDADVYKILLRFFSKHGKFDWRDMPDQTLVN